MLRLCLSMAVAAILALSASAEPAAAARGTLAAIWGPLEMPDGRSAFPTYRRLGVDVLHTALAWSTAAPTQPADPRDPDDKAYQWPADLDTAVREARRYRMEVAVMVTFAPGWANGNRPDIYAPTRSGDFADFVTAASRRYRSVRLWMIWGEPNRAVVFQPQLEDDPIGPRRYARILDAAYGALKARSSRNVVIGGNTFTTGDVKPVHWLRWMRLPNGRPPRLDWWGHNPFSTRFPRLSQRLYDPNLRDFSDLDTFRGEIARVYRRLNRRPRLWLSEWTIQSDHGSHEFNFFVDRSTQAKWVTAGFRIANGNRWIAGLGWYQLLDEPESIANNAHWGLMTATGKPKPAYHAYKRAAR